MSSNGLNPARPRQWLALSALLVGLVALALLLATSPGPAEVHPSLTAASSVATDAASAQPFVVSQPDLRHIRADVPPERVPRAAVARATVARTVRVGRFTVARSSVSSIRTPTSALQWGAYSPDFPGGSDALASLAQAAGEAPDYVMWYVHWAGPYSSLNTSDLNAVRATGAVPLVTWMSDDPSDSSAPGLSDADIAHGSQDGYITQWAEGLKAYGGPVLLRFDPEMNGNWFPWSAGVGGTTAAQYVAAWRHVHDLFAQAGASNVSWVWSPNVAYPGSSSIDALYPGDAYVDWMALDGYNWGTVDAHTWQTPATVFGGSVAALTALSDKPVMLAEVGSSESGGDKAVWIADLFAFLHSEPRIRAFIWFDADKETDWRFDSSSAAAAAFQAGLATITR